MSKEGKKRGKKENELNGLNDGCVESTNMACNRGFALIIWYLKAIHHPVDGYHLYIHFRNG